MTVIHHASHAAEDGVATVQVTHATALRTGAVLPGLGAVETRTDRLEHRKVHPEADARHERLVGHGVLRPPRREKPSARPRAPALLAGNDRLIARAAFEKSVAARASCESPLPCRLRVVVVEEGCEVREARDTLTM